MDTAHTILLRDRGYSVTTGEQAFLRNLEITQLIRLNEVGLELLALESSLPHIWLQLLCSGKMEFPLEKVRLP